MPVAQGHFGSIPEGLYPAPPIESNTSLVQQAITRIPQPPAYLEAIELLLRQGVMTAKRADSIRDCDPNRRFALVCGGCGTFASIRAAGCNSRLCVHCNRRARGRLFNRLVRTCEQFDMLRFLTIGFVNVEHISAEYFKQCSHAFDLFKKFLHTKGYTLGTYVCVMEVKYHKAGEPVIDRATKEQIGVYETAQWNVHYHILFDGDYIPQAVAQEMFKKATKGESFYTYIKACVTQDPIEYRRAALGYVCSYLGKVEGHDNDPAVLVEFYRATHKIRFYRVGIKKKDRLKREKLKLTCVYCDSQHWITPYMEGKYWDELTVGRIPDENAVCLKPPHPKPILNVHEDEAVTVTYEDFEGVNAVKYSRRDLLTLLATPQSITTLCVQYRMSEEAMQAELETLAERGDIMELSNQLWVRVQ